MISLMKSPSTLEAQQLNQLVTAVSITIVYLLLTKSNLAHSHSNHSQSHAKLDSRGSIAASPEPPEFEEPIGNHTVVVGRDAQLSCKINKLGSFRTAWLRVEDKGILTIHSNILTRNYRIGLINNDDGRNFILTIKNVQPSDKGGYMCQINSVPMKFAVGYLDVLTPPAFEDALTSATGVQVAGTGTSEDQPSAQPLAPAASNYITAVQGTNISLSCRASGHPSPIITWRREDNKLIYPNGAATSEGFAKVEGSTLAFSYASRSNSGAYLCIASNGVQPAASKRQLLDIQYSPVIVLPQVELGAQLNQHEVKIHCFVELNPLGSYHWVKLPSNGRGASRVAQSEGSLEPGNSSEEDAVLIEREELINSDKFDIVIKQVNKEKVQLTLTIRRIERSDFAWYKCIARNSLGIQSNSVRLYESSSFSLSNMFTDGLAASTRTKGGNSADETAADQPAHAGVGSNKNNPQQHSSRQQATGNSAGINQARAHTRSSWLRGNRPSGEAATPSGALLDSSLSGSNASSLSRFNLDSQKLLLLVGTLLLASVAQFVVKSIHNL